MYQFYYSRNKSKKLAVYREDIKRHLKIESIRPTMWEEHCLECSAPACYKNCPLYLPRRDGRCQRFYDGIQVTANNIGCGGQAADIHFKKWSNMMTIIFPNMLRNDELSKLMEKNQELGNHLANIVNSFFPQIIKWEYIRTIEYLRRRSLKKGVFSDEQANYFVFHGYSFETKSYHLIMDIYDNSLPVYKKSFLIEPGENMYICDIGELSSACLKPNNLIKIYPENDIEAELELLWCDFVYGQKIEQKKPYPSIKCVVWDLDRTIWDGTLLEVNDPDTLKLRPGVAETIRVLDERGIIQSIASKNQYEDAWKMVNQLGICEYFLYPQINWDMKSNSLKTIANKLNINLDTFAFIDDSLFEREQVLRELPQVRVYDHQTLGNLLLDLPEFQGSITEESKMRRKMYQSEEIRTSALKEQGGDIIEFLKDCKIKAELFVPCKPEEIERCYELIVRTNQLNMTGNKYTKEEYDRLREDKNRKTLAFRCKDKYGEYGITGFLQYQIKNGDLVFEEFTMSCRVSNKYIESAIFKTLLKENNCKEGIFPVNKTNKNYLLRNTLKAINCPIISETNKIEIHRINMDLKHWDIAEVRIENQTK